MLQMWTDYWWPWRGSSPNMGNACFTISVRHSGFNGGANMKRMIVFPAFAPKAAQMGRRCWSLNRNISRPTVPLYSNAVAGCRADLAAVDESLLSQINTEPGLSTNWPYSVYCPSCINGASVSNPCTVGVTECYKRINDVSGCTHKQLNRCFRVNLASHGFECELWYFDYEVRSHTPKSAARVQIHSSVVWTEAQQRKPPK